MKRAELPSRTDINKIRKMYDCEMPGKSGGRRQCCHMAFLHISSRATKSRKVNLPFKKKSKDT